MVDLLESRGMIVPDRERAERKHRLLMLDVIERIEIHIRSVVAHEIGYHDPLAYQKDTFINPKKLKTWKDRKNRNLWADWSSKQQEAINRSKEDNYSKRLSIKPYKRQIRKLNIIKINLYQTDTVEVSSSSLLVPTIKTSQGRMLGQYFYFL